MRPLPLIILAAHLPEPETIEIFLDCNRTINDLNRTINDCNSTVKIYSLDKFFRALARDAVSHQF